MLEFIHMLILIRRVLSPKTCFGVGPLIIVKKRESLISSSSSSIFHLYIFYLLWILFNLSYLTLFLLSLLPEVPTFSSINKVKNPDL